MVWLVSKIAEAGCWLFERPQAQLMRQQKYFQNL